MSLPEDPAKVAILIGVLSAITVHAYSLIRNLQIFGHVPGYRPLIAPYALLGGILPRVPKLSPGLTWQWDERRTAYFNFTHDVISIIPLLSGKPSFFTCSVEVLRQILGNEAKNHLTKPLDLTLDSLWGDSVASASGETWRRHRRIVGPAFNTKTYQLVRETTSSLYQEMIEQEGWSGKQEVTISSVNKHMFKFSLLTLAHCGFGMPVSWTSNTSKDEDMSFIEAITVSAETIIAKLLLPDWMLKKLPLKPLQNVDRAWTAFDSFVNSHMQSIKQEIAEQGLSDQFEVRKADILHRLVASSEGDTKYKLSEKEVLANIFTILIVGHETTANGIITTLGYLAIHQDEQEKARSEVLNQLGSNGQLNLSDSAELPYLQACFQEAVRLFSGTLMHARTLPKDLPVKVERPSPGVIVLPKGSRIIMDMVNIFRNPNVFENPEQFKPSRWLDMPELDIPMFGTGPRACIGRKFAHSEAICLLALFLRDWVLDVELAPGETRAQYEERVMVTGPYAGTILGVDSIPLKIKRRT